MRGLSRTRRGGKRSLRGAPEDQTAAPDPLGQRKPGGLPLSADLPIDGTQPISGHGTKDVLVWGDRYAADIIHDDGEFGVAHPQAVRCRILELVFYLAKIQKP